MPAYLADTMRALRRHVSISHDRAAEFWERTIALVDDFSQLPHDGDIFIDGNNEESDEP